MRTEKELWQIVLDHPELFYGGLCGWILYVWFNDIISYQEYLFLDTLLKNESQSLEVSYFIGTRGEIQPRIDWIKKRMEEL